MSDVVVITGASGAIGRTTARINILGERVAPWFLDWYLAKTGYGAQMTKQPLHHGPDHDNLFEPVDGDVDRGSHGPFDDQGHEHSFQTTLTKHSLSQARSRPGRRRDRRRP